PRAQHTSPTRRSSDLWRPTKLRLLVDAQRSPAGTLSGFIARHAEQPGSRHSSPASIKMRSSPSASACRFTRPEPGTTIAHLTFRSEEHTSELQSRENL